MLSKCNSCRYSSVEALDAEDRLSFACEKAPTDDAVGLYKLNPDDP